MKKVMAFVLVLMLAMGSIAFAENALVGRWEGIGSVYAGMNMEPMGEWVEFREDMTGTLFMLKEFSFTYSIEGDKIKTKDEFGLTFDGRIEGDELILDNGIEYHFARSGAASAATNNTTPAATDNTTINPLQESVTYGGIYCRENGVPCELLNEGVVFNPDNTGVFTIGENAIQFEWDWFSDSEMFFVDGDGDFFLGTLVDDLLVGVYTLSGSEGVDEYMYVFQNITQSGASMAPAIPSGSEVPAQGGAYNAVCCIEDGAYMECTDDGLRINADGTGTFMFCGSEYGIDWLQDGSEFSFTDVSGDHFAGVAVGDVIRGMYTVTFDSGKVVEYEYIFYRAVEED